jgi:hypothetical protein
VTLDVTLLTPGVLVDAERRLERGTCVLSVTVDVA